MKDLKSILILLILSGLISSCARVVVVQGKHDNGKHKGWYKNENNPHNPMHAGNNGKSNTPAKNGPSKSNGNGKGNSNGNGNGKGNSGGKGNAKGGKH